METLLEFIFQQSVPLIQENPVLFLALVGGFLGFYVWSLVRKKNQDAHEIEAKTKFNWTDEVETMAFPKAELSAGVNAARLAVFAVAAYGGSELWAALDSKLKGVGILLVPWENENAQGLLSYNPHSKTLLIGVAGTNDLEDAGDDADFLSKSLSHWPQLGIPIAEDACSVRTTAGFERHALLAYKGIDRAMAKAGIDDVSGGVVITGHSLGGAVTINLLQTEKWQHARAFVYGAPKPYRYLSKQTKRDIVQTMNLADPVVMMPPQGAHSKHSVRLFVRGAGKISTGIPIAYRPLATCFFAFYLVLGLIGSVFQIISGKKTVGVADGHSMVNYFHDLRPIR